MDRLLGDLGANGVEIDDKIAKISIVGVGMIDRPGIASGMFDALAEAGINIKMISTSEIKISVLVDKSNADKAVQAIHAKFFVAEQSLVDSKSGY